MNKMVKWALRITIWGGLVIIVAPEAVIIASLTFKDGLMSIMSGVGDIAADKGADMIKSKVTEPMGILPKMLGKLFD